MKDPLAFLKGSRQKPDEFKPHKWQAKFYEAVKSGKKILMLRNPYRGKTWFQKEYEKWEREQVEKT